VSVLGKRIVRREDPRFITGSGEYLDDITIEGEAHAVFIRSTAAHARILEIDTEDARNAPGVLGIFTAQDIDLPPQAPSMPMINGKMVRPWLATDKVRYVGECVAVVVAQTRAQATDAADLVFIDLEEEPPVVDPLVAEESEHLIFQDAGTNVAATFTNGNEASDEELFADCEVIIHQKIHNQRVAPCPLEPRVAASVWKDGKLTHYASTQEPHAVRSYLTKLHGLKKGAVRVISRDVGGGFGAKTGLYPEEGLVSWLALKLDCPVHWAETRSENMMAMGHGRGQWHSVSLGGDRDGTIKAYRLHVLQDAGAYPLMGAIMPFITMRMASGVYTIPKVAYTGTSVLTNTTPMTSYRGAGRPEAAAAIERGVDCFAAEIGMDPADVRRRNMIPDDAFPYTTVMGTTYDSGAYTAALDTLLEAGDYAGLREEQRRRREEGSVHQLGLGLSVYVEITNPMPFSGEFASVQVHTDGTATVLTGTSPHGQGHETSWAMIASAETGIPIEKIKVCHGDTDIVPSGVGTMGSRSLQVGGMAVHQAALQLADIAKKQAASLLEANPDDITLDKESGVFHVAGTPAVTVSWQNVASAAEKEGEPLLTKDKYTASDSTFPFGAHLAVVDVDTETGKVVLDRMIAVDDAGVILNPLIAEGQIHGGLAQGAAQALLEEVLFDEEGNPITANFADYGIISATELPSFETISMETPTPVNTLGAKGIGESGTIGSTPAVHNAVVDALSHMGIRHIDMPTTPMRVWETLASAKA